MKNYVRKVVVVSLMVVLITVCGAKAVFAANTSASDLLADMQAGQTNKVTGEGAEEIPEGNNTAQNNALQTGTLDNKVQENKAEENKPTTTPYTGVGDYSSVIFIVIFAASAVYAYKKIKEYNV